MSLHDQLEPHIQQLSQNPPAELVALERFVGVSFHSQALWPTNLHTYLLLGRSFLSAPLCDLGLSKISVDFRRHIIALTSLVAESPACSLGAVSLKTPGNSSFASMRLVHQPASGERGKSSPFKEGEKYALNAIVSATKLPARRGERARVNLVKYYGEAGLQKIALICGFLGFTNTIGELLCLPVDMKALSRATSTSLSGTGFTISETRVKDLSAVTSGKRSSIAYFVQVFAKTEQLLRGFPSSNAQLNAWMQTRFEFVPRYMLRKQAGGAKRSLCRVWNLGFYMDDPEGLQPHIPFQDKLVLGILFFRSTQNGYLLAHFAHLAHSHAVPVQAVQDALAVSKQNVATVLKEKIEFKHLSQLLACKIAIRDCEHYQLSCRLLEAADGNVSRVMELVNLMGLYALLQRYTAVFDDGSGLEHECEAAVETDIGKALGLANMDPYTANSEAAAELNSGSPSAAAIWGGGVTF
ncbi:hypothetical protein HDU81_002638 [Chytriomyces hyalinus]|nr:hypothetical protein HDU81_002638 [Chytriomyces hyalinus]